MTEAESRQEAILRKVRGLMAKAASTEFPEERDAFQAKADELMEQYAIESWMLASGSDESKARLIKRREFDMTWWRELRGVDSDAKNAVYWLWTACVRHCRCVTDIMTWSTLENKASIFGTEADLTYLDLLFTDLFTQLFAKIKPAYDPDKSLGENVLRAKEAGMKYTDIAVWLGHPEWRERNGTGGWKTCDNGKMLREYKSYLRSIGKTPADVISVNPKAYQYSYCYAFYTTVSSRMYEMRQGREDTTGSTAIALRDIEVLAKEAMWDEFPDLRPHPEDCQCEACTAKAKPIKYRQGYQIVHQGYGAGRDAGAKARIAQQGSTLTHNKRQLDS